MFVKNIDRDRVYYAKKTLKQHSDLAHIWIAEDANQMIKSQQNYVKAICQLAAKQNIMVKPKGTKLIYNGRQYNHSDIGQLPEVISLAKAKTRVEDQFIAFVGPNAPLSNMYLSPIVDNGESFASVEHAFQAKKLSLRMHPK